MADLIVNDLLLMKVIQMIKEVDENDTLKLPVFIQTFRDIADIKLIMSE